MSSLKQPLSSLAQEPAFVQKLDVLGKPNGEIDQAKAIIAAIVLSLIIVGIIWLIRSATSRA